MKGINRVLRYLKGEELDLKVLTDADFAHSLIDRKSTTGVCSFLGGNLISRKSKKQKWVALSRAEFEMYAFEGGLKEALWIRKIF